VTGNVTAPGGCNVIYAGNTAATYTGGLTCSAVMGTHHHGGHYDSANMVGPQWKVRGGMALSLVCTPERGTPSKVHPPPESDLHPNQCAISESQGGCQGACALLGPQRGGRGFGHFAPLMVSTPCNNNPGVCVKGADPAVLTGREANGRNPTALLG
jgi:hypothetical protein